MLHKHLKLVFFIIFFGLNSRLAGQTNQVSQKTVDCGILFSILHEESSTVQDYDRSLDELIQDKNKKDFQDPQRIQLGISQLFIKFILNNMVTSGRAYLTTIADLWYEQIRQVELKTRSLDEKDLQKYLAALELLENNEFFIKNSKFKGSPVSIKEYILYLRQFNLKLMKEKVLSEYNRALKGIAENYYRDWIVRSQDFGGLPQQQVVKELVIRQIVKEIDSMKALLLFEEDQQSFLDKLSQLDTQQKISTGISFTQSDSFDSEFPTINFTINGIQGQFNPVVSAVELYSSSQEIPNYNAEPVFSLVHGATTYKSTVVSWSEAMKKISSLSNINLVALDQWGSLESLGIALSDVSSPLQYALYSNRYYKNLRERFPFSPIISVGRSFGSTTEFAAAFYNHLLHIESDSNADLITPSSFSNPFSTEAQIELAKIESSHNITLREIPGSYDRVLRYTQQFIKDLIYARDNLKEELQDFGDNILFLQGEIDEDSIPKSISNLHDKARFVSEKLFNFKNIFAPLSHAYFFENQLKDYPLFSEFLSNYPGLRLEGEGAHLLYSSRPNIKLSPKELKNMISSLPDEIKAELSKSKQPLEELIPVLLPRFQDQLLEIIAVKYAMLDYLADYSPFNEKRSLRLKKQRYRLTGSLEPLSFFRYFITDVIKREYPDNYEEKINMVFTKQIFPGRNSSLERFVKVLNFIEQEIDKSRLRLKN